MIDSFRKILRILDFSGKNSKRNFFLIALFVSIGAVFDVVGISMMVPLIATMIPSEPNQNLSDVSWLLSSLTSLSEELGMITLIKILVFVFLMKAVYSTILYYVQSVFCFNTQASISEKLALKYLSSPPEVFYSNDSSDYLRNCIQETDQFNFTVMISFLSLIAELVVITLMAALLVAIDWKTSLLIIGLALILSLSFTLILRVPLAKSGANRQHHFGLRLKVLREAIDGFKELSISAAAPLFLKDFISHNRQGNRANYLAHWMSQLPRMWIEFFAILSIFSAVYIVLQSASNGAQLITTIGIFAAASVRLMPSASRVMTSMNYLIYSTPVTDLLSDEIKKQPPLHEYPQNRSLKCSPDTLLAIESGSYSYKGSGGWKLDVPTLFIGKREKIAIFGDSGSGKTTLLDLLSGFKILTDGVMQINIDQPPKSVSDWWSSASYCSQSVFIFDRDLDYNITMSDDYIDHYRLDKVKHLAGLDDLACTLEAREEKSLGEVGGALSGGQRQRVGIARALYKRSTVVSFFDEVTSNLDEILAHQLVPNILEWNSDKSVIFISHDKSLAKYFDVIYTVKAGVITREK